MEFEYVGSKTGKNPSCVIVRIKEKDKIVSEQILKHVVRHSPTGFEWGYGGSGPADLALSILSDFAHRTNLVNKQFVERYYQSFKWDFVAIAHDKLRIISNDIIEWIEQRKK